MFRIVAAAAVLVLAASSTPRAALAQALPTRVKDIAELNEKKITLSLTDSTVRDALKGLFAQAPVDRCIFLDNSARGLLNFSVKDVPFEGALVSILRSSRRPRYAFQGDQHILLIRPETAVDRASLRVTLDVQDMDVRYLLKALMQGMGANYTLEPGVSGRATLSLDNVTLDHAIERVLAAAKATFTMDAEANVYRVRPKP